MTVMEKESYRTGSGYLLALGLSEAASHSITTMRNHYWRTGGDLTFRLLPPHIPLVWSLSPFPDFAKIHVPIPPKDLFFSRIDSVGKTLYLASDTIGWTAYVQKIRQYLADFVGEPFSPPMEVVDGPYLGSLSSTGTQDSRKLDAAVTNRDWRLQHYAIEWVEEKGVLVHLKHTVLSDIHLI